jgi:23S rRNA (guanosine2251-2'-O)-methyltransferase
MKGRNRPAPGWKDRGRGGKKGGAHVQGDAARVSDARHHSDAHKERERPGPRGAQGGTHGRREGEGFGGALGRDEAYRDGKGGYRPGKRGETSGHLGTPDPRAGGHRGDAGHEDAGRFRREDILLGWHPVHEALVSGARSVCRVMVSERRHDSRTAEIARLARERGIPLVQVPEEALKRLAGGDLPHQGFAAEVAAAPYVDPESLYAAAGPGSLFVVLDEIQDPRNLGAVIRSAAAVAATGVFLPARRSAPLSAVAAKASAGGTESVPVARVTNLARALERLGEAGVFRVGLDVRGNDLYTAIPGDRPIALVLGAEDRGLRPIVRDGCDLLVRIPVLGKVDSLNVSVAAGIALYEVLRARRATGC